jgi:uncharacterized protein YndB with AHSA1/START domain
MIDQIAAGPAVDPAVSVRLSSATQACYSPRGAAGAAYAFTADVRADPGRVWTALTDPGQTAVYLYGLTAHSTWLSGDPIEFRVGDRTELTGRVLYASSRKRLSYLLRSGPEDPPTYVTWLLRPTPAGSAIRLEIYEVDDAGSPQEAEDVWRPVFTALQLLVNPI